jgi:hypothetical protein
LWFGILVPLTLLGGYHPGDTGGRSQSHFHWETQLDPLRKSLLKTTHHGCWFWEQRGHSCLVQGHSSHQALFPSHLASAWVSCSLNLKMCLIPVQQGDWLFMRTYVAVVCGGWLLLVLEIHLCILLCHIVCLVIFHTLLSGLICTTSVHSVSNAVVHKGYSVVLMVIANHVCKGRV